MVHYISRDKKMKIYKSLFKEEKETVTVEKGGMDWYIQKIDSTHLNLSTSPKFGGMSSIHVRQLDDNEFGKDVLLWMQGKKDITGKSYDE